MSLSKLEVEHVIALCRTYRNTLLEHRLELQERERCGWNGPTVEALRVCEAELELLRKIVAKLWMALNNHGPPPLD